MKIYEKEMRCISNELCTKINDEMFYMFNSIMTYGFKHKLWKDGDTCSLPIKITLMIELDDEPIEAEINDKED